MCIGSQFSDIPVSALAKHCTHLVPACSDHLIACHQVAESSWSGAHPAAALHMSTDNFQVI